MHTMWFRQCNDLCVNGGIAYNNSNANKYCWRFVTLKFMWIALLSRLIFHCIRIIVTFKIWYTYIQHIGDSSNSMEMDDSIMSNFRSQFITNHKHNRSNLPAIEMDLKSSLNAYSHQIDQLLHRTFDMHFILLIAQRITNGSQK